MSQNIPCTGWGLEDHRGPHHFPSADAGGEAWARGSSMNKAMGGHNMGQGRAAAAGHCSVPCWWQQQGGLVLEVCNSFQSCKMPKCKMPLPNARNRAFPEQGSDPPGCNAICPALCSSLLCKGGILGTEWEKWAVVLQLC